MKWEKVIIGKGKTIKLLLLLIINFKCKFNINFNI